MEESQQKNEVYLIKSSYLYSEASPNDIQLPERITGGGGWGGGCPVSLIALHQWLWKVMDCLMH